MQKNCMPMVGVEKVFILSDRKFEKADIFCIKQYISGPFTSWRFVNRTFKTNNCYMLRVLRSSWTHGMRYSYFLYNFLLLEVWFNFFLIILAKNTSIKSKFVMRLIFQFACSTTGLITVWSDQRNKNCIRSVQIYTIILYLFPIRPFRGR